MTWQSMAVRVLRQHRYCGDAYPEDGWPEVNAALAQYELEKRHARKYVKRELRTLRRKRRRQARRLTSLPPAAAAVAYHEQMSDAV